MKNWESYRIILQKICMLTSVLLPIYRRFMAGEIEAGNGTKVKVNEDGATFTIGTT